MEEKYNNILNLILLVVTGLSYMIGVMIHSFIVAANGMDWLQGRSLSPVDQSITSLTISRMIFQSVCVVDLLFVLFFPGLYFPTVKMYLEFIELTATYSNIWLFTLISVILCLKISNYNNAFFVCLRGFISQRTVPLIGATVLISLGFAAINIWFPYDSLYKNSTHYLLLNESQKQLKTKRYADTFAYELIFPFLINLSSSVIILISLYHHLVKMRSSNNLTTHLGPFIVVIKSTILCILGFAVQVLNFFIVLKLFVHLGHLWAYVIWNYFPILHSGYIIYRSNKLRSRFLGILSMWTSCVRSRRPTSRANVTS